MLANWMSRLGLNDNRSRLKLQDLPPEVLDRVRSYLWPAEVDALRAASKCMEPTAATWDLFRPATGERTAGGSQTAASPSEAREQCKLAWRRSHEDADLRLLWGPQRSLRTALDGLLNDGMTVTSAQQLRALAPHISARTAQNLFALPPDAANTQLRGRQTVFLAMPPLLHKNRVHLVKMVRVADETGDNGAWKLTYYRPSQPSQTTSLRETDAASGLAPWKTVRVEAAKDAVRYANTHWGRSLRPANAFGALIDVELVEPGPNRHWVFEPSATKRHFCIAAGTLAWRSVLEAATGSDSDGEEPALPRDLLSASRIDAFSTADPFVKAELNSLKHNADFNVLYDVHRNSWYEDPSDALRGRWPNESLGLRACVARFFPDGPYATDRPQSATSLAANNIAKTSMREERDRPLEG